MRCVSNLLSLVLADDELVQASADLLGRRESRPRRGRRRGVGVRGGGSRLGRREGAGTGGEEAANSREHEVRGCSGRSSRRTAMYFPISRCGDSAIIQRSGALLEIWENGRRPLCWRAALPDQRADSFRFRLAGGPSRTELARERLPGRGDRPAREWTTSRCPVFR